MIGILGSGFGLYGYMPAIAQTNDNKIFLLERYKEKFKSRKELTQFNKRIKWVKDLNFLFSKSETLIIALSPIEQEKAILKSLKYSNIKNLILEKPLGVNPRISIFLLNKLVNSQKIFRIGYLFSFTDWAIKLSNEINLTDTSKIIINWSFLAHHYKNNLNNWKRFNKQGGSVLRFYGIHLIALASKLGYNKINSSKTSGNTDNDFYKWECSLTGNCIPELQIHLNSNSENSIFCIESYSSSINSNLIIKQKDPFDFVNKKKVSSIDSRVVILKSFLKSLDEKHSKKFYNNYNNCNLLWKKIEFLNTHE